MFLNAYHVNVPYNVYSSIFTQEFNIKFGFPRSNTCSICDILAIKINNSECSTEKRKKLETEKKGKRKSYIVDKLGLVILCENKFRFYSHQLWCNVFGAYDLGSDSVTMFTYNDGGGRKGSNEVRYMLLTYINNNNEPLDNLVLISDNICGQKNQTMVHFLFTLVHCFHVFKTVMSLFPVRGHSYLPNDQDFSLVDKKKRHIESVELPKEWDSIIQVARKKPLPFNVANMHYPRYKYHGPWQTCTVQKKPMPDVLDLSSLYATHPPIAPVKKKDLQQTMSFAKPENRRFYEDLISGITK
ncbi:hypothetical protein PR048_032906 [Dryococelus australis]|uniref:DUF7869 domain-containing protein n=1 Tax=Dryococelus australis TaxID=614101 RepID=A0ABQ9G7N3_9NEOP|nr:hypothetical protein PR048_032906 [Dryococelus australis]